MLWGDLVSSVKSCYLEDTQVLNKIKLTYNDDFTTMMCQCVRKRSAAGKRVRNPHGLQFKNYKTITNCMKIQVRYNQ